MGAAHYLLVKDLPGRAARISRLLGENPISDDLLISIGGVAGVVATMAAAVACRDVGAPMPEVVRSVSRPSWWCMRHPSAPSRLVVFAAAVILLARKLTRGIGRSHAGTDAGVRG